MGALIAVYALIAFGFILCFFGKFPGQVLAYAGMLVAYFSLDVKYPMWILILCGVLVLASLVINKKLVPKMASKIHEFGKAGRIGTFIGSLVSIICMASLSDQVYIALALLLILPYLFAFLFEFISQKNLAEGAKRAAGAYSMFVASTLLNIAICTFCLLEVIYGWA